MRIKCDNCKRKETCIYKDRFTMLSSMILAENKTLNTHNIPFCVNIACAGHHDQRYR